MEIPRRWFVSIFSFNNKTRIVIDYRPIFRQLAQLVRAFVLYTKSRGFKSPTAHQKSATRGLAISNYSKWSSQIPTQGCCTEKGCIGPYNRDRNKGGSSEQTTLLEK